MPGVTVLDPEAVRRAGRRPARKRNFFGLAIDEAPEVQESGIRPSSSEALAPPSAAVRKEMIRLRAELAGASELEAAPDEGAHPQPANPDPADPADPAAAAGDGPASAAGPAEESEQAASS